MEDYLATQKALGRKAKPSKILQYVAAFSLVDRVGVHGLRALFGAQAKDVPLMPTSLIEELPKIVAEGKKEVERIMERLSSPNRLTLQTNELVLPSKDKSGLFRGNVPDVGTKHGKPLTDAPSA